MPPQLQALIGVVLIPGLALVASRVIHGRSRVPLYPICTAVGILALLATVLQSTRAIEVAVIGGEVGDVISREAFAGIETVFGRLAQPPVVFATAILPAVIYFSALMSALYYLGFMQWVSRCIATLLHVVFRGYLSGSEALVAVINVFAGQTEAPLAVKPYVSRMSRSQLVTMMTCGFATVSAPLAFVYASMLSQGDAALNPYYLSKLISASFLSIPAALLMAKIIEPSQSKLTDEQQVPVISHDPANAPSSLLDAIAIGAKGGVVLAVNIGALLIAFGAILALVDLCLVRMGGSLVCSLLVDQAPVGTIAERVSSCAERFSLSSMLGIMFRPIAWIIGIDWSDSEKVGRIFGEQLIATEFVAFRSLADLISPGEGAFGLSLRNTTLAIFALCGFASLPSIGVQIGALSAIAPEKRRDIVNLAPRAMLAGLLASWLTAALTGLYSGPPSWNGGKVRMGYSIEEPFAYVDDRNTKTEMRCD